MSEFPDIQIVLEPHAALVTNDADRTLQLLRDVNGLPQLAVMSRFSRIQWRLLLPILRAYPSYVAYEDLIATLRGVSLPTAQQQLEEARRTKTLRQELKAVRNAIDHIDAKLTRFNFTLAPIHQRGYALALLRREEKYGNSPSFVER